MKDLNILRSDDIFALPESINHKGEVVGLSCDASFNCRGFIWRHGVMTDLNSVLPVDSPLLITNAADINSSGEIAVQAWDQTLQDFVAAVLTPSGSEDGPFGNDAESKTVQRKVILPENVRKLLRQRRGFGRFARASAWER